MLDITLNYHYYRKAIMFLGDILKYLATLQLWIQYFLIKRMWVFVFLIVHFGHPIKKCSGRLRLSGGPIRCFSFCYLMTWSIYLHVWTNYVIGDGVGKTPISNLQPLFKIIISSQISRNSKNYSISKRLIFFNYLFYSAKVKK